MQNTPKQLLKLLITGLIGLIILGVFLFFRGGKNKDSLVETQAPANNSSDAIVINNHGGNMEGHTPRGFQGMGTGLFAGDNLNPGFPNNDGVQFFLTFDLGAIPSGASAATPTGFKIASAVLRSENLHVQGTPFEDLGVLKAEVVSYDVFSSALWNRQPDRPACTFGVSSKNSIACAVTDAIQHAFDNKLRSIQFRIRFEKAGDGDRSPDLALFYKTDSNKNEPGIFQLEVMIESAISDQNGAQPSVVKSREVSFSAPDGYKLSGTLWTSAALKEHRPAIILSHQFNSTRHDYDSFVPILLKNGYAVLAYDTRGFGESKNGATNINDFPKDIIGAVDFLKKQTEIDPSRLGIIGASVGANVAFVVSGSVKEIRAAVALSPSNTGSRGVLLGNDMPNFSPQRIFIASDEREKSDADFIFAKSVEPKEQKIYLGFGHGIGLLRSSDAPKDILSFLERMFTVPISASYNDIHIPVALHIVKNSGQVSTARTRDNVLALFQKSRDIWQQARIIFDVRIEETTLEDNLQKAVEQQNFENLYVAVPKGDSVLHIFFVETLGGPNGITIAPSLALVADHTTVNDFRATAHEIGHLLGLSHTNASPARLLYRGANGTMLTAEEIKEARRNALQLISNNPEK